MLKVYTKENTYEIQEIITLLQLCDLLRSIVSNPFISLFIPMMPYARQDKHISDNTTFGINTFATLINNLKLDAIYTLDIHSDEAFKVFNSLTNIHPIVDWTKIIEMGKYDLIVFPDKGAHDRYSKFIINDINKTCFLKIRDQLSGDLY